MTSEERQALREKHWPHPWHEIEVCDACDRNYPCDTIKVLDAWDESDFLWEEQMADLQMRLYEATNTEEKQ
jgi:hypothetical protein